MLGVTIPSGALFYGKTRRRTAVVFDEKLRNETRRLAAQMRDLYVAGETPPARYDSRCDKCSLYERCLPKALSQQPSASRYLHNAVIYLRAEP